MNESQKILEDSITRLFGDLITREALTRIEESTWDDALWNSVVELGLPEVLVSEARDGMGGGWMEAFIVARACGRHAHSGRGGGAPGIHQGENAGGSRRLSGQDSA